MKIPFAQIDAFADRPFTGNPAAVMPLDAWLDDDVLQAIAQENNLSETAFIIPDATGESDYELRWFTPAVEAKLCGHATLASGHYFLRSDVRDRVSFRTRAGILEVGRVADGYQLYLPAYFGDPIHDHPIVSSLSAMPDAMLWHPNGYLLVVYKTAAEVRTLTPDFSTMATAGRVMTIATAPGDVADVVSRVFVPAAGIDEDPVTGSAHCLLTPYWAKRLERDAFTAYQASARGGHVGCRLAGDRVVLSGQCATVIEGVFTLADQPL
jgi:predicted PhzF superfamily epimerase YddE/YHI9